jgi:RNA polymerase sigma factor FliA
MDTQNLVEEHLPLVKGVARKIRSRLRFDTELDELVSIGTLGMLEAAPRFDPEEGVSFGTYMYPRIWGAIITYLHREDALPRTLRKDERRIARARSRLEQQYKRSVSDHEIACAMRVPVEWVWKRSAEVYMGSYVTADEDMHLADYIIDHTEGADDTLDKALNRKLLLAELERLSKMQRKVLLHYFVYGEYLPDIGKQLHCGASRQLHKALRQLQICFI